MSCIDLRGTVQYYVDARLLMSHPPPLTTANLAQKPRRNGVWWDRFVIYLTKTLS
jgi:hypothetical protein